MDAVFLFERYTEDGDSADLKGWADQMLPQLRRHFKMAKALNR